MNSRIVNIGIFAHVDAGKTTLTERLLFDNGAIPAMGSVDAGSTTTDSHALERERGITIRSAVADFQLGDLQVNVVDTPGHPDFIAEVERALSVVDGAVLVISAVEGIQAQTKVLMRSLQAAQVPTLIFVNKIDRKGARPEALLEDISKKLATGIVSMNEVVNAGGPDANVGAWLLERDAHDQRTLETLAEHDLDILAKVVDEQQPSQAEIISSVAKLTVEGKVCAVFNGSALVGTGVRELARGIQLLLPNHADGSSSEAPEGIVFAMERLATGEKIAYMRLLSGELRERQDVTFRQADHRGNIRELSGRVTELGIIGDRREGAGRAAQGTQQKARVLTAGNIAKVRGLSGIRVGAHVGGLERGRTPKHFPAPNLEAVVRARRPGQQAQLHAALMALSDEDPLIRVRLTSDRSASLLLYGEVQKEVIAERLIREFGVESEFSVTSPIYFERPIGGGEAEYVIDRHGNYEFCATIGLKLVPGQIGDGNRYVREVTWGQMPPGFYRAIEESVMETLEQGLFGWPVTDCSVHLVKLGYDRPITVAADFRCLTPMLVMRALSLAKTRVYEPCQTFELEVPDQSLGEVINFLSTHEARIGKTEQSGTTSWTVFGEIPAGLVQEVAKALPGLSHGEAVLMLFPGADRPVHGAAPTRPRTDGNPLDYQEYTRHLTLAGLMPRG